ncbi:hypothetical protein SDC9_206730 [bioreactor metagenome]|uniref:Uncharacterized protein n=1 Tax=bioreactor metagenome TaxID=1076179 RepID=A0A645JHE2_9ZZZZ
MTVNVGEEKDIVVDEEVIAFAFRNGSKHFEGSFCWMEIIGNSWHEAGRTIRRA